MFMNVYVHGYVYVYDSICWALKCPVHCAEQFLELKICISRQFRAIDPPNPAGGFIQQNENVRFATAACMQKYGNVRFATVACAKCMRYGGRGGGPYHGGGGWQHGTRNHIYIYWILGCLFCARVVKGDFQTNLGMSKTSKKKQSKYINSIDFCFSLSQWPNFDFFGITYLVGKISRSNFFFQGPLAEWGFFFSQSWNIPAGSWSQLAPEKWLSDRKGIRHVTFASPIMAFRGNSLV